VEGFRAWVISGFGGVLLGRGVCWGLEDNGFKGWRGQGLAACGVEGFVRPLGQGAQGVERFGA